MVRLYSQMRKTVTLTANKIRNELSKNQNTNANKKISQVPKYMGLRMSQPLSPTRPDKAPRSSIFNVKPGSLDLQPCLSCAIRAFSFYSANSVCNSLINTTTVPQAVFTICVSTEQLENMHAYLIAHYKTRNEKQKDYFFRV